MTNHNGNNPPPSMASLGTGQPPKRRKYTRRTAEGPFQIEKGIPIPEPSRGTHKYPWGDMAVGDSFFVPNAPKSLAGSASKKRDDGREYTARKEKNGMRVWRTK